MNADPGSLGTNRPGLQLARGITLIGATAAMFTGTLAAGGCGRPTSYLFITDDLNLVRQIAHRIAVMYRGEIVELIDVARLPDGRDERLHRFRHWPTRRARSLGDAADPRRIDRHAELSSSCRGWCRPR